MSNPKCSKEKIIHTTDNYSLDIESYEIQKQNDHYCSEVLHKTFLLLKRIAKLLRFMQKKNQQIVTTKELEKFLNASEVNETYAQHYFRLDSTAAFQKLYGYFSNKIDINIIILKLFTNCLTYISSITVDSSKSIMNVVENIAKFQYSIYNFSQDDNILVESKIFKSSVYYYLQDLFKILSNCEYSATNVHGFQRCSDIRSIIIGFAKLHPYQNLIIYLILTKFQCVLTYFRANENFDGFTYKEVFILDIYLSITKAILYRNLQYLDPHIPLELKQILEELKFRVQDKLPCILVGVLENIIRIL